MAITVIPKKSMVNVWHASPSVAERRRLKSCGQLALLAIFATGFPLLVTVMPASAENFPTVTTPYEDLLARLQGMAAQELPNWKAHPDNLPHGEDPALNDGDWAAVSGQHRWEKGPAWFRQWVEIPRSLNGYGVRGARIRLDLRARGDDSSQARIYFNGTLVEMGDDNVQQPILLTQSAEPGTRVLVAVNFPVQRGEVWMEASRMLVDYPAGRPDPGLLVAEIRSAYTMISLDPEGRADRARQLDAAVKCIDFAALDRGDESTFESSLRATQEKLQPLGEWARQFTIRATGHSHIDMAWLWPWTETVEVVRNTFSSVLQLMRQYPDLYYAQSSAAAFMWMEEKYPALFQEIQQRVKEGRWEIVGGMWVEPDLNLPSGESMVRQVLLGKRYFQQKFGVDVKTGWNPDTFGFTWQIPQIYKRSGIDYFITRKLGGNDTTKFPYKLFWWEAPDGSRVLSYFPQAMGTSFDPVRGSYDMAEYHHAAGLSEIMLLYGVGDHGGGPTRAMLDEAERWKNNPNIFPKLTFGPSQTFFDDVMKSPDHDKLPVWRGELYFQFHRGVYTTQAETKKRMRQSEELLLNAEKFASLAMLDGQAYPHAELESDWQKVLFDQFHDILPGSGIAINYVDAARALHEVDLSGQEILSQSLTTLAARIDTRGEGVPVVLFNPLSWKRNAPVEVQVQFPSAHTDVVVKDAAGSTLPSEVISRDPITHVLKVRVLAKSVPGVGYTVIHVVPTPKPVAVATALEADAGGMENEFLRVKVDPHTGCITSLVNKQDGREEVASGACANLLQTFVDTPQCCDAWNIDSNFEDHMWNLTAAEEVKLFENTPVRAVIRVRKKFQSSSFIQDITLYPGVPRVDVRMQVDWHEKHILLKVAFPVSVDSKFATYEIPYGTIQRLTTRNTPEERAMFEVPAQRWGDLSDSQHGLSILNDCKYGYDAKANVIRLSLLRSPTSPDPNADQGFHEFTYALYPHAGDWKAEETERQGYELNYPLIPFTAISHDGVMPASRSLVGLDPANVILTVAKRAEDDDQVVYRFFEFEGKTATVRLRFPQAARQAAEVNLMEKLDTPLPLSAHGLETTLTVHPYEIVTVKADFRSSGNPAIP